MSFTEPAGRPGTTDYQSPQSGSEPWLNLAADIDSEVARYFLISARCGCFMQAARSLNVRSTLLRKQLAQLEQQLQHSLFGFQGSHLSLTREGQQLQARLITLAHERKLPIIEQPLIRLAVAESILHDILGRDLIALLRRNASLRLEIIALDSEMSLRAVSADIVLWLAAGDTPNPGPTFATTEARCLARIEYLPHIAKRYSRVTTRPQTQDELADFMLVQWQHDRRVEGFRPWNALVEGRLAGVVQTHAYELMLEMIRCGGCIGLLPTYMARFDRGVVALPGLFAEPMQLHAWLAVNADSQNTPEIKALADLIQQTFNERHEWFQP
ncbi:MULTISPECIES: substrate-binding domain-containing protein [unclassified Pseudomonas]|jgi:DNA-binding transcriptional LysR family regulator|uniref:substrate-binding domain-containing protein n=1 Tax=unclassified Pseudomonas TaxID=196821 RepID=UPI0028AEACDF|nr:LysR family transcriptional regulator [Pseudomonas sp.]